MVSILYIPESCDAVSYKGSLVQCSSLVPRPLIYKMGKGLVTLLAFFGCADSTCTDTFDLVLVVLNQQCAHAPILFRREPSYAQPRKASNVTRPFTVLWVGSGDETTCSAD